jgi:ribonuclease T2
MRPTILFVAVVVCVALASHSEASPLAYREENSDDYAYVLLVNRWPGTYCRTASCNVRRDWFTLHGFWPDRSPTSAPFYCNSSYPFNEKEIEPLEDELRKYWTDFSSETGLWKHEWEKHGTCMLQGSDYVHSEYDFFRGTLNLREKINLVQALAAKGITPDDDKELSVEDLEDAVTAMYSMKPVVVCKKYDNKVYLLHMRFCSTPNLDLSSCGQEMFDWAKDNSNCGDGKHIVFPTFPN